MLHKYAPKTIRFMLKYFFLLSYMFWDFFFWHFSCCARDGIDFSFFCLRNLALKDERVHLVASAGQDLPSGAGSPSQLQAVRGNWLMVSTLLGRGGKRVTLHAFKGVFLVVLCCFKSWLYMSSVADKNSWSSTGAVLANSEPTVQTQVLMHSPYLISTVLRDQKKRTMPEDRYMTGYSMSTEQISHHSVLPPQQ